MKKIYLTPFFLFFFFTQISKAQNSEQIFRAFIEDFNNNIKNMSQRKDLYFAKDCRVVNISNGNMVTDLDVYIRLPLFTGLKFDFSSSEICQNGNTKFVHIYTWENRERKSVTFELDENQKIRAIVTMPKYESFLIKCTNKPVEDFVSGWTSPSPTPVVPVVPAGATASATSIPSAVKKPKNGYGRTCESVQNELASLKSQLAKIKKNKKIVDSLFGVQSVDIKKLNDSVNVLMLKKINCSTDSADAQAQIDTLNKKLKKYILPVESQEECQKKSYVVSSLCNRVLEGRNKSVKFNYELEKKLTDSVYNIVAGCERYLASTAKLDYAELLYSGFGGIQEKFGSNDKEINNNVESAILRLASENLKDKKQDVLKETQGFLNKVFADGNFVIRNSENGTKDNIKLALGQYKSKQFKSAYKTLYLCRKNFDFLEKSEPAIVLEAKLVLGSILMWNLDNIEGGIGISGKESSDFLRDRVEQGKNYLSYVRKFRDDHTAYKENLKIQELEKKAIIILAKYYD